MVVRNQAKTMKNGGKGNKRTLSVVDSECIHNVLGDNFIKNEIGSTTNSPAHEEVANDNQKQKYGSNFTSRLQVCLTAHEAHEAENLTPREGNCVDENPPKRVRTKYIHENRLHERQGTQLNDPNSSEASTTSAKRKKGHRGKYRSLALEKKTIGGLLKLDVDIPYFVFQVVGKNARPLVNFCGYVVKTTAFMDAGDWCDVFAKHGHSMWFQVKKDRLHYYYKECGDTLEERINNPAVDFPIEYWKACCAMFDDEKFKKRSLQNSKNRRSDKWTKHTIGNLSFPEVEHILTNDNVLPDPNVVWQAEHKTLDGEGVLKWVNDGRSKDIHTCTFKISLKAGLYITIQDLSYPNYRENSAKIFIICYVFSFRPKFIGLKDKDKEPEGNESRPQTQDKMLLHVLGPKSGYTRGKGNGYRGSAKARLQEEQQKIIQNQQDQISNPQNLLEANIKAIDDYKEEQRQNMAAMEKRFMEMITRNKRCDDNL
ncbi:3-isopropylmalate dehydratase large subunit [Bienertia sinuspersici]